MFSQQLLRYFRETSHAGLLPAPAVTVRVENPVCGDILELSGIAENDVLQEVGFRVRGCTASIAAGSAAALLLKGKTLAQGSEVDAGTVEQELGGLASTSKHAARLAADGVAQLIAALRARE